MTCFRMKDGATLRSYCIKKGLSYWTMQTRCDKYGLSPEEAVSAPPRKYKYTHILLGEPLKTLCKREGLRYQSVLDRATRLKCPLADSYKHFKERDKSTDGRTNRSKRNDTRDAEAS